MKMEEKEFIRRKDVIKKSVHEVFNSNMDIFTWNIPENSEKISARLILKAMEEGMDEIRQKVETFKFTK